MTGIIRWGVVGLVALLSLWTGLVESQGDYGLPEDLGIGSSPLDLVFVVDTSQFSNTSGAFDREIMVKTFLNSFLDSADVDSGAVKVAMVTYSTHPEVVFELNTFSNTQDMTDAIYLADFKPGERNTADALARVRSQVLVGDRQEAPNVVLLIQSGKSDRNEYRTLQEAEALKYARANVFVVGYGLDNTATQEVNEIASKPTAENTFLVSSVPELDALKEVVFAQILMRAEQAYNSPAAGSELLDVAFLVHFSNTMKRPDYQRVIAFMKTIVEYSSIDDDKVRVAAAIFRKRGIMLFDFNSHYSKSEVIEAIDKISFNYRSKSASITDGLNTLRSALFVDSAGARRDVPNLVILITDSNADTDIAETIKTAEQLKAEGTTIYTVGINVTLPDELRGLASSPNYALMVDNTQSLQGQVNKIHEDFAALRTEGFPLMIPAFETTTTPTTTTSATSTSTSVKNLEELDVVIAVHVSHNTKIKDIKKNLMPFMEDIVSSMDIDSGAVRASVVVFGTDATVKFDLKKMKKSKKLLKGVKNAMKPANVRTKGSDIVKALNTIQTDVFVQKSGDRDNVPNLLMVLTDSASPSQITDIIQESAAMERSGTTIFSVGIKDADTKEIESLASDPSSDFSFVGKSYSDYTTSADLRRKLSNIKIFENLKAPKTGKPTTQKPPKRTKKPPVTKPPKKTKKPLSTTTQSKPTTLKRKEVTTPEPVTTTPRKEETTVTTKPKVVETTTLRTTKRILSTTQFTWPSPSCKL